jgi:hypothetical protein
MTMLSTVGQGALFSAARRYGVLLLLASIAPANALAAPLDKNGCAKLAQEFQNLKALDVDKLMENGPSWAVSHLSPTDLDLIRQYIDLDEQMKFRCAAPSSLVHLKNLEPEDEDSSSEAASADAAPDNATGDQPEDGASASKPKQKAAKPAKKAAQSRQENSAANR